MTDTRPESQVAFLVRRGMTPERAQAVVADLGPDLTDPVVRMYRHGRAYPGG